MADDASALEGLRGPGMEGHSSSMWGQSCSYGRGRVEATELVELAEARLRTTSGSYHQAGPPG